MTPRLKEIYSKEIKPALKDSLGLKNIFMAPRIEKIVLNRDETQKQKIKS